MLRCLAPRNSIESRNNNTITAERVSASKAFIVLAAPGQVTLTLPPKKVVQFLRENVAQFFARQPWKFEGMRRMQRTS
jgi:hypothetical protein